MNKEGYESIDKVLDMGLRPLKPIAFELEAEATEALVLDLRDQLDFAHGHIPRSINIGLDGSFAPWVGALVQDVSTPILLVLEEGREEEAVTRLARVGFDQTIGYLDGSVEGWKKAGMEIDTVPSLTIDEFVDVYHETKGNIKIFDVRKETEFLSEHIIGANNAPLDFLNDHLAEFPTGEPFYLHCEGGYRSMIAASILKSRGYHNMIDVDGGFKHVKESDIPVSDFVCPTTL